MHLRGKSEPVRTRNVFTQRKRAATHRGSQPSPLLPAKKIPVYFFSTQLWIFKFSSSTETSGLVSQPSTFTYSQPGFP